MQRGVRNLVLFCGLASPLAYAQVAQYGQCGGATYTGSTTCVSPYVCVFSNNYYSQCLAGTGPTTTPPKTTTPITTTTAVKPSTTSTTARTSTTPGGPTGGGGGVLTYRGADFSSLPVVEAQGTKYSDGGSTKPFEQILANHGTNLARIRIWTAGDYQLPAALKLATRAKAAGMKILVDLHYSDTWADPGHQAIPSSWPKDLANLNTQIYTYTKSVVTSFVSNGTPPDLIQIGNEIRNGLLFPVGQFSLGGYNQASQLVHSGVNGARDGYSGVKIVIHIDNGWDQSMVQSWYKNMIIQGAFTAADVDIMGFSFYPFYGTGATTANLKSSLSNIISIYGKDVLVAETDFPYSCSGTTLSESISPGPSGQLSWTAEIRNVLTGLSGGHGKGIVYWEPGWVGNANLGSSCSDALLVDGSGASRSSISMFSSSM